MKTKRKLAVAASTLAGKAAMARTSVAAAMTFSPNRHSPRVRNGELTEQNGHVLCAWHSHRRRSARRASSAGGRWQRLTIAWPRASLPKGLFANHVILDGTPDGARVVLAALGVDYGPVRRPPRTRSGRTNDPASTTAGSRATTLFAGNVFAGRRPCHTRRDPDLEVPALPPLSACAARGS